MRGRCLLLAGVAALAVLPIDATAQGSQAIRRIAMLSPQPAADVANFQKLLQPELERLGWGNGKNIVLLEPRTTNGSFERLPALAGAVVAETPDLILVQSAPATRALMGLTKSIPIVMVAVGDPVRDGLVRNLRNPEANVTGSSYLEHESALKTLEILKEAVPQLRSVAVLVNANYETAASSIRKFVEGGRAIGVQIHPVEIRGTADIGAAFEAIGRERSEAVLVIAEPLVRANRDLIAQLAARRRLPVAVVGSRRYLPESGLIAYGPTTVQYARITARYVDRILRGDAPATLPVEQPANFELVVNVKAAKALGLTIPPSLLLRADEVVQ